MQNIEGQQHIDMNALRNAHAQAHSQLATDGINSATGENNANIIRHLREHLSTLTGENARRTAENHDLNTRFMKCQADLATLTHKYDESVPAHQPDAPTC